MTSEDNSKQDLVNRIRKDLPKVAGLIGNDKLDQWVAGDIGSVTYDRWLSQLNAEGWTRKLKNTISLFVNESSDYPTTEPDQSTQGIINFLNSERDLLQKQLDRYKSYEKFHIPFLDSLIRHVELRITDIDPELSYYKSLLQKEQGN